MQNKEKLYLAIIWLPRSAVPGQRVTAIAKNLDEALEKLESQYGKGNVYNLHNDEDANRPR